jgi:hypothetical protein
MLTASPFTLAEIKYPTDLTEDLHFNDPTIPFLNTVREFCRYVEKPDWENADAFIKVTHKTLVRLYCYGLELSLADLSNWYADTLELEENVVNKALQNIQRNTPFQYYWTVLNPLELEMPSTGTGDLIDDLFDIYKDLKLSITYFDKVEGYQEWALWTFKMTFLNHWSDHCINAVQIIHNYLSSKE